jgi:hypothetical protein
MTGPVGSYDIVINRIKKGSGILYGISQGDVNDNLINFKPEEINTIDVGPYLPVGDRINVGIICYDNSGARQASRNCVINVSSMNLTWEYDEKQLNEYTSTKNSMELNWSVSGSGLEKTTYITINDDDYPYEIASGTETDFTYELKFADFNMTHGAYTIKMWATTKIGVEDVPTEPIYKNIIVAQEGNSSTIISVGLFKKELMQYNTVSIPVYIYDKDNTAGTAIVNIIENGSVKDQWFDVPNLGTDINKSIWNYTPTITGDTISLVIQSGGSEYTNTIAVKGIGIDIKEK